MTTKPTHLLKEYEVLCIQPANEEENQMPIEKSRILKKMLKTNKSKDLEAFLDLMYRNIETYES